MPKKRSEEEVFREIENEDYSVISGNYVNQKSKIKIKHNLCGYEFEMDHDHWHNRGQRCPKCHKYNQKKSHEDFLKLIESKGLNNKYEILSEYTTKREKILVKCLNCGNQFSSLPCNLYKGVCKFCAAIKNSERTKLGLDGAKKKVENEFTDYILVSDKYNNNKEILDFKCRKCGTIFSTSLTNLRGGTHCPKCFNSSSKKENDVKEFLLSFGLNTEKLSIKLNNRRSEIDIFNKDKNIGVEFNGLYWHSDKFLSNSSMKNKLDYCNSNEIRLVNIFEDEWDKKQEIVKDKLQSIFGIRKKSLYARDCEIVDISTAEKNKFLDENHIQGKDTCSKYLGLVYKNELIAVITFSKLRRNLGFKESPDGVYELSRFAGKIGYGVAGGFSKLLKYSIKRFNIKKIITYADLRWTSLKDNVYLKNGFTLDHISKPSYFYLDKSFKKRLPRFTYRKNNLKNLFPDIYSDDKSEAEIMSEAGYHRIYDCGNAVYTLEIK